MALVIYFESIPYAVLTEELNVYHSAAKTTPQQSHSPVWDKSY